MELSSQEAEIPMPINSVYGGVHCHGHGHAHQGHMTHHHQDPPSSSSTQMPSNNPNSSNGTPLLSNINNGTTALGLEDQGQEVPYSNRDCNPYLNTTRKKSIRYRECQKNHAASMGGDATDGCGEFMPSGVEGTLEALTCSACNCHRNFHRKEIEGDHQLYPPPNPHHFYLPTPHHHPQHFLSTRGRKVILGSSGSGGGQGFLGYPTGVHGAGALIPVSRAVPINVPYQVGPGTVPSEPSDEHDHHHHHHDGVLVKKRFRTKFSQEQKEKMLEFAEKVGWKIQKQEEGVVQQFCQEVGVKRRVLKVWMHNNKHNYAKKNDPNTNDNPLL